MRKAQLQGAAPPPGVVCDHLSLRDSAGRELVHDLCAEVAPGELLALRGGSECARTAVLLAAAGISSIAAGRLLVGGIDLATLDYRGMRAHRLRTGFAFSADALLANQTLRDNLALPLRYHLPRAGGVIASRLEDLLEEFALIDHAHALPGACSAAVRKRALIARALVLEPTLVLLEDPLVNLGGALETLRLALEGRRGERGLTIVQCGPAGDPAILEPDRELDLDDFQIQRFPPGDSPCEPPSTASK